MTIGASNSAENLAVCANPKQIANAVTRDHENFVQTRQKNQMLANISSETPTSVVTRPLLAMTFGSKQKSSVEKAAPHGPQTSSDQRKIAIASRMPVSSMAARALVNIAAESLRKSLGRNATVVGTRPASAPRRLSVASR